MVRSFPARLAPTLALALALSFAAAPPAAAATLRLASAFDPQTMDPHSLALLYQTRVGSQIYEGLVHRGRDFQLEPALATAWTLRDPTTWRFTLRPGVTFHDGAPFTADDAVFSIERALQKTSQRANQLRGVTGARKVDPLTIEVLTATPDAVLPEKLWQVGMMSKAWAEKHKVTAPQDYNGRQETYAVRNANGTGPYVLVRYEADVRTTLRANPNWWGRGTAQGGGNVDEAVYTVIQSDATRLAALASKQVDMVMDPPFQDLPRLKADPAVKVVQVTDIGTQYLAFDQHSAELPQVPGRNPFKDLRVRRAVQLAIDTDLIVRQVLRGEASSTASFVSAQVEGHLPELEKRAPPDPAAARKLLAEAGYDKGFAVQLDCVNVAYRSAVCQAIAAMLDRVGIKVAFQPSPSSIFFPKLSQASASFVEFGWSPGTDAWGVLHSLVRTYDGQSGGVFNAGRYSNPKLDAMIDAIRVEPDAAKRRSRVGEALRLLDAELPIVPIYRRKHSWVLRPGVSVVQWPNDVLELRWVKVE